MKKNIIALLAALLLLMSTGGCGDSAAVPENSAQLPVQDTESVQDTEPAQDTESVQDTEPAQDTESVQADDNQDTAAGQDTPEKPGTKSDPQGQESAEKDDALPVDEKTEDEKLMDAVAEILHNYADSLPIDEEKLVDTILEVCSTQALPETDLSACVVDVRSANPYDVDWFYGPDYLCMITPASDEWDDLFDVEYYKKTFPMLAIQFHNDDDDLWLHFRTVGLHEGRQGSESFNVKAFMDTCPAWLREKFGDNYACYYLYWIYSDKVDRSADLSGKDCPKQMTAVMTLIQKEELRLINEERENLGVEPLVFDSELAAIANYRCWTNAAESYYAHDWAKQNNAPLWDMVYAIGGNTFSENTTTSYDPPRSANRCYYSYYASPPHYEAMVDSEYGVVGSSNLYAGDLSPKDYDNIHSEALRQTRYVHFDTFMDTADTALNPN